MNDRTIGFVVWKDDRRWFRKWRWRLEYDHKDAEVLWAVKRITPLDDGSDSWHRDEGGAFSEEGARRSAIRCAQRATIRFYADRKALDALNDAEPQTWADLSTIFRKRNKEPRA